MRKQILQRRPKTTDSPALLFELQDCSDKGRSPLRLPYTSAETVPRLTSCRSTAVFSSNTALKVSKRGRHNSQQQPCFASLLQSLTSSKPANSKLECSKTEVKSQATEAKKDASAKFQTAAGWSKHLLCGALSAVVSRTTMAPLERIKLEIVLHKRQETMFEVALGVLERDGKSGFWKGNGINLLRTAPYKVCTHLHAYCLAMWQPYDVWSAPQVLPLRM